jgi:CRISPR-associated protein Cmr2
VEELLKSAKKKARKLKQKEMFHGSTIDFVVLKSIGMIANNIQDFRMNALRRNNDHLTAKPYTVTELKELLNAVRALKNADFPRTQIYRLRKQIEKGWLASSVDYLYFRGRLPKEHAEKIREAIDKTWIGYKQPGREGRVGDIGLWLRRMDDEWKMTETEWETFIGDLADIYDFVS